MFGVAASVAAVVHLSAVSLVAWRQAVPTWVAALVVAAGSGVGALLAGAWSPVMLPVAAVVGAVPVLYAIRRRGDLFAAGAVLWASYLMLGVIMLAWVVLFLLRQDLSATTTVLLWGVALLGAVAVPSVLVQAREGWEPLLRRVWRRPRTPLHDPERRWFPMVSVHVPCHAEPPDVVVATLERIAALDYPSFEVLVVDNNTTDEALWRPLEAACERLGPRFRFLHVEELEGAKAGALNWALPQVDPAAEVIAVVDADYQVDPRWLRRTIGYFDDPRMGFVQSPHAYRGFADSTLGRWADAEYAVFFATGMVALNEHNAGLTVGTMSLIRRSVLEEVGGWAEWCLTEDSELAIRVHAAGYDSVYLTQPYGRGLIPETFAGYRKQRFRWTYGPVQELKRHWRLFLPGRLGQPSALTLSQRLHHANHGLDVIFIGVRALALPLGALAAASMAIHQEHVQLPVELWVAATSVLVGQTALRLVIYRRLLGATLAQALGGTIAFAALNHVIITASLRAALSSGSPSWERTSKFRSRSRGLLILGEARTETLVGLSFLLTATLLAFTTAGGLAGVFAIGLAMQGVTYLAAPLLAFVGDRDVRRAADSLTTVPGDAPLSADEFAVRAA